MMMLHICTKFHQHSIYCFKLTEGTGFQTENYKIEHRVELNSSRCMHDPSFMALALIVSEKMT